MSAGAFSTAVYEDDNGDGFAAKVQPESINAFNPNGTAAITQRGRIKLSSGRREFGLAPRTVSGVWITAPAGYKAGGTVKIPIMTKAAWDAIDLNESLTYLTGGSFRVTGKNNEKEN